MLRNGRAGCQGGVDVNAGRHHRYPDGSVEALVKSGADNDVGVRIDFLADAGGGLVDLVEREIAPAGDRDQEALGALHR